MKKTTFLILLSIIFLSKITQATVFTFSGKGNWNDTTHWSPSFPVNNNFDDSIVINGHCTILANETISIGNDTSGVNYSCHIIISDTLINNGNLITYWTSFKNLGYLYNNGIIQTSALSGDILLYGQVVNFGQIGSEQSITNFSTLDNYGSIWGFDGFGNNGTINSYNGSIGSGPLGGTFNNGTINGKLHSNRLINNGNSILSPGFGLYDTDTMFINYEYSTPNQFFAEINGAHDNDIIIVDDFPNHDAFEDLFGDLIVSINPAFTPSIGDTFVLIQSKNLNNYPFNIIVNYKINPILPPPPVGYTWIFKQDSTKVYITLDFALPEFPIMFRFYAEKNNNSAVLKYSQQQKDNDLDHFVVERADKDFKYVPIGEFKYDENKKDYVFTDSKPLEGDNIYHLLAYNKDGKLNVNFCTNSYLLSFYEVNGIVLNTLVENQLNISSQKQQRISVINMMGEIILNQSIEMGHTNIDLSQLSKGIYFVRTDKNVQYKILKL